MKQRKFGHAEKSVSEIGFGAWAIGGSWGDVAESDAKAALHAALDNGTTFIDTADVYGDGRSERIIADVLKERSGPRPFVATKAGRRLDPHVAQGYTAANLNAFVDRSLKNLEMERLDLVQLHCPPTEVYYRPEVFDAMDRMIAAGKLSSYGVSVEKVEEGLKAIEYPGVKSVQIIYNIFRQRPARFIQEARDRGVAVIVRVPLASGLLTGKMTRETTFAANDHRLFNRNGEAFDKGETFAGVPYDVALDAVEEIRSLVPQNATMAQFALRWILMNDGVTTVIPGAKNAAQAKANSEASELPPLTDSAMEVLRALYLQKIAPFVHHQW
ncbi:aldo/keto reductase [Paraburkholderia graminis]|jgi:aryl-alcohol dehydrogenase-like predicted oxidoreductase|uniref:Aryl-alcohol dehydrogenase-like predicted oxidoreductase n=1 Tax=Paraburkholderia graminis TaxID=60548 RepID=A0ABD5CFA4_9BURK|nr:aldo/keto reductase [Paraburkholderia graminis]MDQ0623397.1 aryl-alcohol dehydrogenase-like predicted oxidoreductase [Paraburkholderia graminis]MDR6203628.1 aryl-alcohol dehydrogenase-like predicted oxidoreductase [Paraburkholderia graminis]